MIFILPGSGHAACFMPCLCLHFFHQGSGSVLCHTRTHLTPLPPAFMLRDKSSCLRLAAHLRQMPRVQGPAQWVGCRTACTTALLHNPFLPALSVTARFSFSTSLEMTCFFLATFNVLSFDINCYLLYHYRPPLCYCCGRNISTTVLVVSFSLTLIVSAQLSLQQTT